MMMMMRQGTWPVIYLEGNADALQYIVHRSVEEGRGVCIPQIIWLYPMRYGRSRGKQLAIPNRFVCGSKGEPKDSRKVETGRLLWAA